MRHSNRTGLIVAVFAVAVAACSGSEAAETTVAVTDAAATTTSTAPTTSTTTVVESTTTTSEAPAPTEAPTTTAEAPAEVALDDFEYIIEELSRRRVAMYADPNLDAIAGICSPESPCEDLYTAQIGEQIELRERTVGEPSLDVIQFEVVGFDKETLAESAAVVVRYTAAPLGEDIGAIVDGSGDVVIELAVENPDQPVEGQMNLLRSNEPGLPWRIVSQR